MRSEASKTAYLEQMVSTASLSVTWATTAGWLGCWGANMVGEQLAGAQEGCNSQLPGREPQFQRLNQMAPVHRGAPLADDSLSVEAAKLRRAHLANLRAAARRAASEFEPVEVQRRRRKVKPEQAATLGAALHARAAAEDTKKSQTERALKDAANQDVSRTAAPKGS